jgi:cytochrome c family protein
MKFYKSGQRANAIMADIAGRMSDAEVNAVANFIQGLH